LIRPGSDEVRARGWWLLSSLYLHGVTEEALPALRALPELADVLPEPYDAFEAGAAHQSLFGLQVLPYASVYLERSGVLGGAVSASVGRAFQRAGLPVPPGGEAADHLGHVLALLATLTARGDRGGAAELLQGHLIWWLPVFVHSALRHAAPPWPTILRLTLDAAVDQARELGLSMGPASRGPGVESDRVPPPGALGLPVENPLEDADAGLRRVAEHLVTPARGGLYLAAADLRELGRDAHAPAGFGRRDEVMTNLLRSAVAYGTLGDLVDGVRRIADAQATFLDGFGHEYGGPWARRLAGLSGVLDRLSLEGRSA
jgi:TorA maturation chaperone TorD